MISMSMCKTKQNPEGHENKADLNKIESYRLSISLCYKYPHFVGHSSVLREIGQLGPGSIKKED